MIHQDFYKKYIDIRSEEVNALNEAIRNTDDKEVHWQSDFPYVTAQLSNCDGHLNAKAIIVKHHIALIEAFSLCPKKTTIIMKYVIMIFCSVRLM